MQITIEDLRDHFNLELLAGQDGVKHRLIVSDIKRPGIELAGYWEYFTPERLQLLGRTEVNFLNNLTWERREEQLVQFYSYPLSGVIITRNLEPPEPMIKLANEKKIALLRVDESTTSFLSQMTDYLERMLAPTESIHGVLIDVYGVGVLLTGESGIGKSETALELVKRGHRLVADDLVEIKKIGAYNLIGRAVKINQHYMEIRGIGIVDIKTLFGAGAVKLEQEIHLIAELEDWDNPAEIYDRLGLSNLTEQLLGLALPKVVIPVRPGRNLPIIIEVAAMNYRLKNMGYHAAQEFAARLKAEIAGKMTANQSISKKGSLS